MVKKKGKSQLGRSLIKTRGNNRFQHPSSLHTTELNDGYDWGRANVASITEQNDLDEFLATAELAGTDFTAEKLNVTVVQRAPHPGVLTEKEKADLETLHSKHKKFLRIPRRPPWDESTTAEELNTLEKEAFVKWRRELSELQDTEGVVLTPYEKNLEFWRQLWRVVERSDVVVQIVDARNPLLFYCEDLVKYVQEVDPNKKSMVLLNKSDYLTPQQREAWAKYLDSIGMPAVFFSALQEGKEPKDDSDTEEDNRHSDGDSDESYEEPSGCSNVPELKSDEEPAEGPSRLHTKDELLHLFKTAHTGPKAKEGTTVIGLVGYPNVGKSSTINALLRSKKVSVSTTPGKTKHFQTLYLDEELCLCDCPGLVFPNFVSNKAEMIINGILPIDRMTDHVPPVNLVASLIPRRILERTYGIMLPPPHETEDPNRPPTSEELLDAYGYMRGYMTPSGVPDNPRAARYILKDFVKGKLLHCRAPPGVNQAEYHKYEIDEDGTGNGSRANALQMRKAWERRTTSRDVDADFFQKKQPQVHSKGKVYVGTSQVSSEPGSSSNISAKPWKKHHNSNKREKLRRVYAAHDA